jgi:Rrf2 family protein
MKISAQEEYGLRCLLRIAQAGDGQSLTIPEVANAEGLSVPYVGKLLSVLRQAGLIESVRGRAGGYRLAANAATIGLGSILGVLGEPLFDDPGYCERHAGTTSEGACVHYGGCTLRGLWQTLELWIRHSLDQITLADLLQSEKRIGELLQERLASTVAEPPSPLLTLSALSREVAGEQR